MGTTNFSSLTLEIVEERVINNNLWPSWVALSYKPDFIRRNLVKRKIFERLGVRHRKTFPWSQEKTEKSKWTEIRCLKENPLRNVSL